MAIDACTRVHEYATTLLVSATDQSHVCVELATADELQLGIKPSVDILVLVVDSATRSNIEEKSNKTTYFSPPAAAPARPADASSK